MPVVKFDLFPTLTRIAAISPGFSPDRVLLIDPNAGTADPTAGFLYASGDGVPGNVNKIDVASFSEVLPALALAAGENSPRAGAIDLRNRFAYFCTDTNPTIVVKVDLTTFTRVGGLALAANEAFAHGAVIDEDAGFLYVSNLGAGGLAGHIVKVDLSTFLRVGRVVTGPGSPSIPSAIDPVGGKGYFGFRRLNLATFTLDVPTLMGTSGNLRWMVIDPRGGFLYVGNDDAPASIFKVSLATYTVVATLVLDTGDNGVNAGFLDRSAGFLYFATLTSPARIIQISLGSFTKTGSLTLAAGEDGTVLASGPLAVAGPV